MVKHFCLDRWIFGEEYLNRVLNNNRKRLEEKKIFFGNTLKIADGKTIEEMLCEIGETDKLSTIDERLFRGGVRFTKALVNPHNLESYLSKEEAYTLLVDGKLVETKETAEKLLESFNKKVSIPIGYDCYLSVREAKSLAEEGYKIKAWRTEGNYMESLISSWKRIVNQKLVF